MSQKRIDILERALKREREARKQAESILELKSAILYETNQKLEKSYTELELLLTKKDSQLQGVFENIVDAYLIMDLEGNILKMNDAALNLLGFENDKVDYNLMKMVDPVDFDHVSSSFKTLLKKGNITNFEIKINTNQNIQRLVHINASIIYDNKIPVAAQGILRDITKEKEAAERLIESENRLAMLVQNLDSGVVLEDENRKIIRTNKKYTALFNLDIQPNELIGIDTIKVFGKNSQLFKNPDKFLSRINDIDAAKHSVFAEDIEMVDGKVLERNYMPIVIGEKSKGFLWTFKDITLRRTYNKRLEAQQQKYYNIISNMNLGLVEVDLEDRILMVNHSFEEMTGYSFKELSGKKGKDLLPIPEDQAIMDKKVIERKKGKTESYELRIRKKDGEIRNWLVSGAPNYNLDGTITGSIGINLDITNIKNLELQKEKLLNELAKSNNELQEYAHIVSHDLKSPLRSINALISWIKEDNSGKLDEITNQNLNLIENTLEKMELLISDILDYSSVGFDNFEKSNIDTNELVLELKQIMYVPEHMSINITTPLPVVSGHKTKLQQVFQNLISNSIKFIDKEKGNINIGVKDLEDFYEFSVQDNGIGIEKQFHDKIFKVFLSLNKRKDSSGIGLSIVQKIVELHEGKIWLESEPGIGTTFFFTIKK